MNHMDALSRQDMMSKIDNSNQNKKFVLATHVFWRNWKELLAQFFRVPSTWGLKRLNVFTTRKEKAEIIFAKENSNVTS